MFIFIDFILEYSDRTRVLCILMMSVRAHSVAHFNLYTCIPPSLPS